MRKVLLALLLLLASRAPDAATEQVQYSYDASGRLIESRSTTLDIQYQYDAAGTLISRQTAPNLLLFSDGFEDTPP